METIGIENLKDKLSECLRAVAAGETVRVTDSGRVVAEIVPPRDEAAVAAATPAATPEEKWAELIRQGVVTPAKVPPGQRLPPHSLAIMTLAELMRDLDESREDR